MESFIPVFVAFGLMFIAIPIPVCLLAGTFVYFTFINTGLPLTGVIQNLITQNMSVSLLAPLFFVTAGTIMSYSGIADKMFDFCDCLLGHKKGGLAYVNVALSTMNGGMQGSAVADVAYQCKVLVPQMAKKGYPVPFSAAVTAATALITPIIPPGTGLILYALVANQSVGRMWAAGYVPGFMLAGAMLVVCYIYANKNNWKGEREHRASGKEILRTAAGSALALIIPLFLIFGLRSGLFTAVEGGTVMVMLAIIIGICYRNLKPNLILPILKESFDCVANVMLITVSACGFSTYLTWERIPHKMAQAMLEFTSNPTIFMLLVLVLVLFLGMFVDSTALLMVLTPIFYPIAEAYGIDLIAFGIILIISVNIGAITPPFGGLMFLSCKFTGCDIPEFTKYALPFILCMICVVLLIIFFPGIATFMPNLIYGA